MLASSRPRHAHIDADFTRTFSEIPATGPLRLTLTIVEPRRPGVRRASSPSVFRTSRLEVLVIGGSLSSANLAVELRIRGIRACVVGDEAEYFALSRQAWLRPTISIVDLALGDVVRDHEVRSRSLLAAFAGIPTMLIGADANDEQLFAEVVQVLPLDADPDTVVSAIRDWASRPGS